MIASVLSALGLGDDVPAEHAKRQAIVAERIAKIKTIETQEVERLNAALAAVVRQAAADTAKEREALEAADRTAGDRVAAAAVPALSEAWSAYTTELGRAELLALATVLRDLDSKCRTATGAELPALLIAASFASAMVSAKPQCEGALLATEYTGEILSPAARLLRGAVAGADVVDLEIQAAAIEAFFAKCTRKPGSVAPSVEQRETFAALLSSGRAVDRAARLREIAERHGAERQRAFEASYTPAKDPIIPHTPQPSHADLFA